MIRHGEIIRKSVLSILRVLLSFVKLQFHCSFAQLKNEIIDISSDRRVRERTLDKLWRKNSGAMEMFIATLEVS